MSHISDSDHRKIEATVLPDCVVELHQISDATQGLRKVQVTKLWRTERIIGHGTFGEVWLQALDNDTRKKRALKVVHGVKMTPEECQRELIAMIEFSKPRYQAAAVFVDFYGWFQNPNNQSMYLAMEYMHAGDLEANLLELESSVKEGLAIPEEDVKAITSQILEGLKIMHAEGFAHRDLKPKNIFVVQRTPAWWVKLGDFGLAKKQTDETAYRTHTGTERYMAPELYGYVPGLSEETSEYTNAVDIWALGCVVHRILTRSLPFPTLISLRNYSSGHGELLLSVQPPLAEAKAFVQKLLNPYPARRPTASAALEDSWLLLNKKTKNNSDNDVASSFTNIYAQSQTGYNTASHLGLQSHNLQLKTHNIPPSSLRRSTGSTILQESGSKYSNSLVQQEISNSGHASPIDELETQTIRNPIRAQNYPLPTIGKSTSSTKIPFRGEGSPSPKIPTNCGNSPGVPKILKRQLPKTSLVSSFIPIPTTDEAKPAKGSSTTEKAAPECVVNIDIPLKRNSITVPELNGESFQARFRVMPDTTYNLPGSTTFARPFRSHTTLKGHTESVTAVAISPNGLLASASKDKTVKLWYSHAAEITLRGHTGEVNAISFSPDGKLLASASWDNTIKLWDLTTYVCSHTLYGHKAVIYDVAFSPDGKYVASASWDETVRVKSSTTLEEEVVIRSRGRISPTGVFAVAFSPDSKLMAVSDNNATVIIRRCSEWDTHFTLIGVENVYSIAFSPDSRLVAFGDDWTVAIHDVATGDAVNMLWGHTSLVSAVAFSPSGKLLASASRDRTIKLWNTVGGDIYRTLKGHSDDVTGVAFTSDGKLLASSSADKTIKIWDIEAKAAKTDTLVGTSAYYPPDK